MNDMHTDLLVGSRVVVGTVTLICCPGLKVTRPTRITHSMPQNGPLSGMGPKSSTRKLRVYRCEFLRRQFPIIRKAIPGFGLRAWFCRVLDVQLRMQRHKNGRPFHTKGFMKPAASWHRC